MSQKATLTKLEDKLAEKVSQFQRRKKKIIQPDLRVRNKMLNKLDIFLILLFKYHFVENNNSNILLNSFLPPTIFIQIYYFIVCSKLCLVMLI